MNKEKTVFILGAGTSKTIGLPLQNEILKYIFTLKPKDINIDFDFLKIEFNSTEQKLLHFFEAFNEQRDILADFIVDNFAQYNSKAKYFALNKRNKDKLNIAADTNVTLEDLFTIFDKIIIGREHFRTYSPEKIQEVHVALRKCIIFAIAYSNTIDVPNNNPVKTFAEKLIEHRKNVTVNTDNLSIITMNWDAYLEKTLFQLCEEYNKTQKIGKIYPDLCFYDYCYDGDEKNKRVVSTQVKAKGYRNIKILKLHGSINWLICPYCGKVFVDYKQDIAVNRLQEECYCRLCLEEFDNSSTSPQLHSILITPTFMKDLNNLNIKNIWHNALLELTEASKVVFIGYSFPDADFEMRCLLKKAIMPEAEIDVVLYTEDNPEYYRNALTKNQISDKIMSKLSLPEKRYASFFGKNEINFYYNGMEEYLQNHF